MPEAIINGININFKVEGDGEPLVMIMGVASTQKAWYFQTRFFRKHFRVITFDNRGCGESDKPSEPYFIRDMAEDTAGLMNHLGIEKAHILGISMGGMIAQELAINYPEKINKLILGCTFARRIEPGGISADIAKKLGYEGNYSYSDLLSVPVKDIVVALSKLAFNKKINRLFLLPMMKFWIAKMDISGISNQIAAIWEHDAMERLKLINASTLVITGDADRVINPKSSEVLAEMVPDSKLVEYKGGSHAFFVEMRERFNNEVLAFLMKE
ncbi:MAG: alpha/beta hydrolase [Dehalococcoidales bacterium]|nr:alpha/beta hydrolase [Dehalococcoidales bacterium]